MRDVFFFGPTRRRKKKDMHVNVRHHVINLTSPNSATNAKWLQALVDRGDRRHRERVAILLIKELFALVGPRGLEFELGRMKFKVPPVLKANPPPEKGSWR